MIYPIELSKLYQPYQTLYEQAFHKFLNDGCFIGGSAVESFEQQVAEYLDANYVVGCGNGTHALQLALLASGVGHGDEVITVANTYYATARAIVETGAVPVFCDVGTDGLIDILQAEQLIGKRTKAIIPVHLYGAAANLEALYKIGDAYKIKIIEDCSHAFGSLYRGKKIGHNAPCACFSLYPTKNLGAMGDAGIIAVKSEEMADQLKKLRYFASDDARNAFNEKAIHSRMDSLQAALLQVSLGLADTWNKIRQQNCAYYKNAFDGTVSYVGCLAQEEIVPYVFPVIVAEQEKFMQYMLEKGVVTQVHYRPMLHKISHLIDREYSLPVTEYLNEHVVSIPVSETITQQEVSYIAECVLHYFNTEQSQ